MRAAQAHAGGVEDRLGERRGDRADRALAGAGRRQFGTVQEHFRGELRRDRPNLLADQRVAPAGSLVDALTRKQTGVQRARADV